MSASETLSRTVLLATTVSPEIAARVRHLARVHDRSVAAVLRLALARYVKGQLR